MTRIIAGRAGGHRLQMPAHQRTRPTTDRVREAVFSALAGWAGTTGAEQALAGLSFADLFAGSGAVALEAASRGASPVLAVEADRRTADLVRANAKATRLAVQVRAERVERVVGTAGSAHDIVWLDPPYDLAADQLDPVIAAIIDRGWVAADGLLVVERSTRSQAPEFPPGWDSWQRRYGETTVHYAQRDCPAPAQHEEETP